MRRLLLISLVTIPLAGCQFFGGSGDESVVDVIEAIEEDDGLASAPTIPAVPDVAGGATATPDGEAFAEPVVESKGTIVASTDLIRSTDPAARTRQVQRNRIDPFANLPIPPTPKPSATNKTGGSGSASGAADRSAAAGGRTAANRPTPPPVRVQPANAPLVKPSPIAALPSIPQPVIAPTVSVSGIIQLGNEPYAIVRSGNEPERYVRVGDRIAGGSVRVKRIETVAFEPRVILEENGIEVSRPIEANSGAPEATPAADDSVAITPGSVSSMASVTAQPGTLPTASSIPALPTLPTIPTVPGLRSLQPTSSNLPNSLLLPSAHTSSQAIVPNFRVSVPAV